MTVHFIGAGPGAADLLTLRAVRLLQESPICLYAGTYIDDEVLSHCGPETELIDTAYLNLDAITATLVAAHDAGHDVARLCSGDPSIYSAIAEQTRRLDAAGVPWDLTPGVPAYAATAALIGRELTVPEVAQSVVLTRAQKDSTTMPPGRPWRPSPRPMPPSSCTWRSDTPGGWPMSSVPTTGPTARSSSARRSPSPRN